MFSWLRAEKLEPRLFEDAGTGGPDFCATHAKLDHFLVEATSLDSEMVAGRSGPRGANHGSWRRGRFALITEKTKGEGTGQSQTAIGAGNAHRPCHHVRSCVCEHPHGYARRRVPYDLRAPDQCSYRWRKGVHEHRSEAFGVPASDWPA